MSSVFVVKDKETGEEFLQPVIPMSDAMRAIRASGYQDGSIDGYNSGYDAAYAVFEQKMHCTTAVGDGSRVLKFKLPFFPQLLIVAGYFPDGYKEDGCIAQFHADFGSFAYLAGSSSAYTSGGNVATSPMTSSSILNRLSMQEDGSAELYNITGTNTTPEGFFKSGIPYTIVAAKYTELSDKERITEYVASLEGSGEVTLSLIKVNSSFTTDEWSELEATKPNWKINLK